MRAAFVSHSGDVGGAERALLELIDGLKRKGVICFVLLPSHGPLALELERRQISFAVVGYKQWVGNRRFSMRVRKNLKTLSVLYPVLTQLKRWNVEVIVTNTITVPIGALAAFVLRKPHVWIIHEFGKEDHDLDFDFGRSAASEIMASLSSSIIVVSDALKNHYSRYIPDCKLHMVYQGVSVNYQDSESPHPRPGGLPQLALVGRLHPGKGQIDAVRALRLLIHSGLKARLVLVGTGEPTYLEFVKSVALKSGLENMVLFTGHLENPITVMKTSDIVLVCSRSEAFGRVTVEAMKAGRPVIGARTGATPEIVKENFNGLLYSYGDCRDLADKIRYLIEHPDEIVRMGNNARRWADARFETERYSSEVLQILTDALTAR